MAIFWLSAALRMRVCRNWSATSTASWRLCWRAISSSITSISAPPRAEPPGPRGDKGARAEAAGCPPAGGIAPQELEHLLVAIIRHADACHDKEMAKFRRQGHGKFGQQGKAGGRGCRLAGGTDQVPTVERLACRPVGCAQRFGGGTEGHHRKMRHQKETHALGQGWVGFHERVLEQSRLQMAQTLTDARAMGEGAKGRRGEGAKVKKRSPPQSRTPVAIEEQPRYREPYEPLSTPCHLHQSADESIFQSADDAGSHRFGNGLR